MRPIPKEERRTLKLLVEFLKTDAKPTAAMRIFADRYGIDIEKMQIELHSERSGDIEFKLRCAGLI